MDASTLRTQLIALVPFNRHVGVEVLEVESGRGVARLEETTALFNHLGTLHAGALFTLADVASGAAVVGMFADELGRTTLVVAKAEIIFSRPARGTVNALATVDEDRSVIEERLARDNRAELGIKVSITDHRGAEVALMSVRWHLRRQEA